MTRLFLIIAAIGAIAFGAMQIGAQASTAGWDLYDEAEFIMAQQKGKRIVVDVHADWCPTCRAQAPILNEIREEHQSDTTLFIKVDFDDPEGFLEQHQIARQSTVLVFDGTQEVARTVAETDRTRLRSAVLSGF